MALISLLQRTASSLWPARENEAQAVESGASRTTDRPQHDPRYCLALVKEDVDLNGEASLSFCWKQLESRMALAPAGDVRLADVTPVDTGHGYEFVQQFSPPIRVESVYLDRYTVTNADFAQFVDAGSYRDVELWPAEVLPSVLHFVDQTRQPGPSSWRDGKPPAKQLDYPVVGVSWYEANAYALWAGKRLPQPAEWQRAATWAADSSSFGANVRYPWGNTFESSRANTWSAGRRGPVQVDEYYDGCTPNGIHQLIGNVWEWQATPFGCASDVDSLFVVQDEPMAEVRGGAFDTYFESQVTSSFRSGKPLLARSDNVGFRCCISADDLRAPELMDF